MICFRLSHFGTAKWGSWVVTNNYESHVANPGGGGETNEAIDGILGRIDRDQPEWQNFEGRYLELCNEMEITHKNWNRTFWNLDYDSGYVDINAPYIEGTRVPAFIMRSERSQAAREACINELGDTCVICRFNFGEVYGEHGQGFIHVHHLDPLAQDKREVDPARDLVPVCPNCHYMLHRNNKLLSPEELRCILKENRR